MRRLLLGCALVALAACRDRLVVTCDADDVCRRGGAVGRCVVAVGGAFCAFDDASCPSGLRWDPTAADGLASACVEGDGPVSFVDGGPSVDGAADLLAPIDAPAPVDGSLDASSDSAPGPDSAVDAAAPSDAATADAAPPDLTPGPDLGPVLWSRVAGAPSGGLSGVAVVSDGDFWVCSFQYVIAHYSAGAWKTSPFPTTLRQYPIPRAIAAASTSEVWVALGNGEMLHTTDAGSTWGEAPLPSQELTGLSLRGPQDIWTSGTGYLGHSTGGNGWTNVYPTGLLGSTYGMEGIFAVAAGQAWTAGGPQVLSTTNGGTSWTEEMVIGNGPPWGDAIWGTGPSEMILVGDAGWIWRRTSSGWDTGRQPVPLTSSTGATQSLRGLWGRSANDVFAVGDLGVILHSSDGGASWTLENTGLGFGEQAPSFYAVAGTATKTYVVGDGVVLVR